MNVAVIFAGGTGRRMNGQGKPKQFLQLYNKPILVYTLEQFQYHEQIDGIVLVILADWQEHCAGLVEQYRLTKVRAIVPGGETGQLSIYNGLSKAARMYPEDSIVLIHDGVRPLIDHETITKDIQCVKANGSAITVSQMTETIITRENGGRVSGIIDRAACQLAKAPQCFVLRDILDAHRRALAEGQRDFIDSCTMMQHYGRTLYTVEGPADNIKITTPGDYYLFRAIIEARENAQLMEL